MCTIRGLNPCLLEEVAFFVLHTVMGTTCAQWDALKVTVYTEKSETVLPPLDKRCDRNPGEGPAGYPDDSP